MKTHSENSTLDYFCINITECIYINPCVAGHSLHLNLVQPSANLKQDGCCCFPAGPIYSKLPVYVMMHSKITEVCDRQST